MEQNETSAQLSAFSPANFGWSRRPDFIYDRPLIAGKIRMITEADRYILFTPTHMAFFEIRDDGTLGYMVISVLSLREKKRSTQIFRTYFPLGSFYMPPDSSGSIRYRNGKSSLDFISMEKGVKIIKADISNFSHHGLRGEVVLSEVENAESLAVSQPYREKNAFRYLRCSPWFIAEGVIQFGSTEVIFTRGNAWGIYDWNRAVRPKSDIRYWASACGTAEERQISFCAGYSFADSSAGTENAVFVDGKLHKLENITFHITPSNWLAPWRFTSDNHRLEMEFFPQQSRVERSRMLFHSSTRRQVFGFFSGKAVLDDGETVKFANLTGFAERVKTRL
jgi:hypothetical protein